jgi:hypothetical protein
MIMCFVVKLVYTKVVDNLCIYLLLKFGGIWPSGLETTAVLSWVQIYVALCPSRTDSVPSVFRPCKR